MVALSGKWNLFPDSEIPRTTAQSWIKKGYQGLDAKLQSFAEHYLDMDRQLAQLKNNEFLFNARIKLITEAQGAFGVEMNTKKIHSKKIRAKILSLIEQAIRDKVPRAVCLSTLGLSLSRYKRWRREDKRCLATPTRTCMKLSASALTPKEIYTMRYYVTSKNFAHFPIKSLCYFAKRQKKLSCAYSTWLKYVNALNWRRPNQKPKKIRRKRGVRAARANEIWHLDVSVIVLPDQSKVYIQAVLDNYSRYVLAWNVSRENKGIKTTKLLIKALRQSYAVRGLKVPNTYVDGGTENNNEDVETLVHLKLIQKTIAQVEVVFSNSMIERLFLSLKHNHLYHRPLRNVKGVKREVDFYLSEHNNRMPHSAFTGETPKERYLNMWGDTHRLQLKIHHEAARKLRLTDNKLIFCQECGPTPADRRSDQDLVQ